MSVGTPMNSDVGFKEANLVHATSCVMRAQGYYCFPEFPYARGSIDVLYVKKNEIIITEFKRVHRTTADEIRVQTKRMNAFDPSAEMESHNFQPQKWKTGRLWICDTWEEDSVAWWKGQKSSIRVKHPFDVTWEIGSESLESDMRKHGDEWDPYHILWAFKKS